MTSLNVIQHGLKNKKSLRLKEKIKGKMIFGRIWVQNGLVRLPLVVNDNKFCKRSSNEMKVKNRKPDEKKLAFGTRA